jgi:hypothetical protein
MSKREMKIWFWIGVWWGIITALLIVKVWDTLPPQPAHPDRHGHYAVRLNTAPKWLCEPDFEQALRTIYRDTKTDGMEWGFSVERPIVIGTDHQPYSMMITYTTGVSQAVVHTHPVEGVQKPSAVDIEDARLIRLPVVVLGVEDRTIRAALPDGTVETWATWNDVPSVCK